MIRALLISSLYNITSYRRLVYAISENIAFRWFCFLGIDDKVFDHSTISVFIERIGRDGFAEFFKRFNSELRRRGMLSKQFYVDSSLVRANLALHNLYPSGLTIEQFQAKAIAENGLFVLEEEKGEDDVGKPSDGINREPRRRYFQDAKGRVQLSPVDLSARRCHSGRRRSSHMLSNEDNIAVDGNGFILLASVDPLLDPGVEGGQGIARGTSLQARIVHRRRRLQRRIFKRAFRFAGDPLLHPLQSHPDNEGCGLPGTFRLPR